LTGLQPDIAPHMVIEVFDPSSRAMANIKAQQSRND